MTSKLAANRSQTDLVSDPTIRLTVVRCGLGQEGAKFEVRGQRQGGNWPEFPLVAETGAIPPTLASIGPEWPTTSSLTNNNVDAPTGVRPDFVPVDYYTESTAQDVKRGHRVGWTEMGDTSGKGRRHIQTDPAR